MTPRRTRSSIVAVALAGVVAMSACSGSKSKPKAGSTSTTRARTTTTKDQRPIAPLSGARADAVVTTRPALTVKIENTRNARPQYGIEFADVIYEEVVEGGITRLAAIFQSQIPDTIGPVRSVRRTDQAIVRPIKGIFVYSGGARYAEESIATAPVVRFNETLAGPAMFRDPNRRAPHNLFLRGNDIFPRAADAVGPPPPLFTYGSLGPMGRPANDATVGFRQSFEVKWHWDAASKRWQRTIFGTRDIAASGAPIDAANVVIQSVRYKGGAGVIGAEAELTGTGQVRVLTRGRVVDGTWRRTDADSVGEILDRAGNPIPLAPGPTWVELPDAGYPVTIP